LQQANTQTGAFADIINLPKGIRHFRSQILTNCDLQTDRQSAVTNKTDCMTDPLTNLSLH